MASARAFPRHPIAIAGVVLTTISAIVFVALTIAMLVGMLRNPYAGLVVFIIVPILFLLGLLLIPLGLRLQRKQLLRNPNAAAEWPVFDFRRADVRRTGLIVLALTAANLVIVLLAGYGSLHWMESPSFCGQACHGPMHPQFTSWSHSLHARSACVECHVSDGASGFVSAKLAGVRQLTHVITGGYTRPIPPGADIIRAANSATCTRCHEPGRASGDRIRVIREYADDEQNSETMTVLQMHVSPSAESPRAIHWHADPATQIEYVANDTTRETIPYVKVTGANGEVKEYLAEDAKPEAASGERSTMSCVDCHNTVGHPMASSPELAVDGAIAAGRINRALPFARREGVRLLKASYPSEAEALRGIADGVRGFYSTHGAAIDPQMVAQTVTALQDVYQHNVFPTMQVTWGSYPDHRGHITSTGCFRCHDDSHKAKDGTTISADCEYCHKQIQ